MGRNRTKIEIRQPSPLLFGLGMLAVGVVAALMLGVFTPAPSAAQQQRTEQEQQQQHTTAMLWQPALTAAENVALIALYAAAPVALVLGSIAMKRAIDARWPSERGTGSDDPDGRIRRPEDHRPQPGSGELSGPRPSPARPMSAAPAGVTPLGGGPTSATSAGTYHLAYTDVAAMSLVEAAHYRAPASAVTALPASVL
jgi:hypothetical protein